MKTRILLVDDEQNARQALRTILEEEGYEIAEAPDGEEALKRLVEFAPAVVLTDVRMPKMDGISLVRKAREGGFDTTFVMMTAFASIGVAVEAMKAGAENFLVKPLDADTVLVVLEKVLEKRNFQQQSQVLKERVRTQHSPVGVQSMRPALPRQTAIERRIEPPEPHRQMNYGRHSIIERNIGVLI